MILLITAALQLVLLIFQEYYGALARAREKDDKFTLDQANLKLIVDAAVLKWNASNAKDSQSAGDAWDHSDRLEMPLRKDPNEK